MNIKCKKKVDRTIITYRLKSGEQINSTEMDVINKGEIPALEPIRVENAIIGKQFRFEVRDALDLKSYLYSGIELDVFLSIVQQIIETLKACESYGVMIANLSLDINYIFVKHATRRVHMLLWPLISLNYHADEKAFFQFLGNVYEWKRDDAELEERYKRFFEDRSKFKLSMFENMLKILQKEWEEKNRDLYVYPGEEQEMSDTAVPVQVPFELDATLVLFNPVLIKKGSNEKIELNHFPFIVGKSRDCDYQVDKDNPSLSRKHFVIQEAGSEYRIIDKSTNGTWLNKVKLLPTVEVQLKSGALIEIGTDEFGWESFIFLKKEN